MLGVAFSPDGKKLLTASRDKTAKVWDLDEEGSRRPTFPEHQAAVYGVAVQADGKVGVHGRGRQEAAALEAAGEGKTDAGRRRTRRRSVQDRLATRSRVLATASADKTVRLWKEDGNPLRTLTGLND